MPILPLFKTPATPDAWHQVRAPGGYEGWYFAAEDSSAAIRISGLIGAGCRFNRSYRREYYQYRKHPTANSPPKPSDHPCVDFMVFQRGQLSMACRSRPGESLEASTERLAVAVGKNELAGESQTFRLNLSADPFMWKHAGGKVEAQLVFSSRQLSGAESFNPPPIISGSKHFRTLSPFCDVEGDLSFGNQKVSFKGRGCLEHRFGMAPLAETIKRGIFGRVFMDDRALVFHALQTSGSRQPEKSMLIELSDKGSNELPVSATTTWKMMHPEPSEVVFGKHLQISNPRVIEPSIAILYDAQASDRTIIPCESLV